VTWNTARRRAIAPLETPVAGAGQDHGWAPGACDPDTIKPNRPRAGDTTPRGITAPKSSRDIAVPEGRSMSPLVAHVVRNELGLRLLTAYRQSRHRVRKALARGLSRDRRN